MSTPSATDKFTINSTTGFGASDITSGSFTDVDQGGTATIYYNKVGKLYFNFYYLPPGFGGPNMSIANVTDSGNRIAFKLGITIAASYSKPNIYGSNVNNYEGFYNTGVSKWDVAIGGNPIVILDAIMAN